MAKARVSGTERPRREDVPLVTGEAKYTDDFQLPGTTYAGILRSQHAHARIVSIDAGAAEALDGVVAVYTSDDLDEMGTSGRFHVSGSFPGQRATEFSILAREYVRYTGEPVAVVVAEDRYVAHEALDLIDVEYKRLEAVADARAALDEGAPAVHEGTPDNLALDWEYGDGEATAAAFDAADHVVELEMENQRLHPDAMEPRTVLADYDPEADRVTVRTSTQVPHSVRRNLSNALGLPEHRVRVIAPAVGGGFGSKGGSPYAEDPLVTWCSIQLERPVKWAARRSESHHGDHHGRDFSIDGELAVDDDGTIRGLRFEVTMDIGAYLVWGKTPAMNFRHLSSGAYAIPAIHGHVVGAFTNTAPIAPYRGAGRPEIIYAVERLVSHAAAELGVDPVEFRRRNLIPPDAFPYRTAVGTVYDSGAYETALNRALDIVGYDDFRERQAALREESRYLGIGLSTFVENTGTGPSVPESSRIVFHKSGKVTAYCGTADHGQGHSTTFSQVLADEFGIDPEDIEIKEGDSDALRQGTGTFGSRSVAVGASSLVQSARQVIEQAKRIAAHRFEADPEDVEFADGEFSVAGAPGRSMTIREVARLAFDADDLPADLDAGLQAETFYDPESNAYSFGTHIAIVEVDPGSGELSFERYVAVDDCGVQINPLLVEGQIHGGVAQGVGQALYEHAVYDESGTLLTGTLQDYALPRAMHMPEIDVDSTTTPCPHNPIGAKGAGESGTIAAPPAIVNAVVDAVRPLGVETVDMPVTGEAVWRAMQGV